MRTSKQGKVFSAALGIPPDLGRKLAHRREEHLIPEPLVEEELDPGAVDVAVEVENLAGEYLAMLSAGLEPRLLDAAELERVMTRFADYGRITR